jgi:hypothetical protein
MSSESKDDELDAQAQAQPYLEATYPYVSSPEPYTHDQSSAHSLHSVESLNSPRGRLRRLERWAGVQWEKLRRVREQTAAQVAAFLMVMFATFAIASGLCLHFRQGTYSGSYW